MEKSTRKITKTTQPRPSKIGLRKFRGLRTEQTGLREVELGNSAESRREALQQYQGQTVFIKDAVLSPFGDYYHMVEITSTNETSYRFRFLDKSLDTDSLPNGSNYYNLTSLLVPGPL